MCGSSAARERKAPRCAPPRSRIDDGTWLHGHRRCCISPESALQTYASFTHGSSGIATSRERTPQGDFSIRQHTSTYPNIRTARATAACRRWFASRIRSRKTACFTVFFDSPRKAWISGGWCAEKRARRLGDIALPGSIFSTHRETRCREIHGTGKMRAQKKPRLAPGLRSSRDAIA